MQTHCCGKDLTILETLLRAAVDRDTETFDRTRLELEAQIAREDHEADRLPGDFADEGYGPAELHGVLR